MKLFTDSQVAALLKIKPRTVAQMRRSRRLPFVAVGRKTPPIRSEDLALFPRAQRRGGRAMPYHSVAARTR